MFDKKYNPFNLSKVEIKNLEKAVEKLEWYFTDTRDGLQSAFISSSLNSTKKVIELICPYIIAINGVLEGGYAGATDNEAEKFNFIKKSGIKFSSFGSSKIKSKNIDDHFKPILESGSEFATIFVKCSVSQVKNVLKISNEENLELIKESILYLKENGKKVIVDLEHFFDGYAENKDYTKECLSVILKFSCEKLVFCDTLGKTSPDNIKYIINELCDNSKSYEISSLIKGKIGLHLHEDIYQTNESIIKSLSSGNISHIQGNFGYSGERVGNTPLALLFVKLYENYNIDVFKNSPKRDILWKNLLPTYNQVIYLLNGEFSNRIDSFLNPKNYYHGAGMHVGALSKDGNSYSVASPKLLKDLDIKNYPGLTKQAGKSNVLYYLEKAFNLKNISEDGFKTFINGSLELLKSYNSLNYTDSLASFLIQCYKILNYGYAENIQKIINEKFGILKITAFLETKNNGEHLNTTVEIIMKNQDNNAICLVDKEKENGIFHSVFKLLVNKLSQDYPYIKNLELLYYETKSQNNNSDANVITKLIFKDKNNNIFSVISQNKNADIANINAIKEAFYYFILCKEGKIKHIQSKLLEIRFGNIMF